MATTQPPASALSEEHREVANASNLLTAVLRGQSVSRHDAPFVYPPSGLRRLQLTVWARQLRPGRRYFVVLSKTRRARGAAGAKRSASGSSARLAVKRGSKLLARRAASDRGAGALSSGSDEPFVELFRTEPVEASAPDGSCCFATMLALHIDEHGRMPGSSDQQVAFDLWLSTDLSDEALDGHNNYNVGRATLPVAALASEPAEGVLMPFARVGAANVAAAVGVGDAAGGALAGRPPPPDSDGGDNKPQLLVRAHVEQELESGAGAGVRVGCVQHYCFDALGREVVREEMLLPRCTFSVPAQFVSLALDRKRARIRREMTSMAGAGGEEEAMQTLQWRVQHLQDLLPVYGKCAVFYRHLDSILTQSITRAPLGVASEADWPFKKSTLKKASLWRFATTNLFTQRLLEVDQEHARGSTVHLGTTCGCFAAHALGLREGGARMMILELARKREQLAMLRERLTLFNAGGSGSPAGTPTSPSELGFGRAMGGSPASARRSIASPPGGGGGGGGDTPSGGGGKFGGLKRRASKLLRRVSMRQDSRSEQLARLHERLAKLRARCAELELTVEARLDVALSQALTALVGAFVSALELGLEQQQGGRAPLSFHLWPSMGFLFQVESLLSTQGGEVSMLEDMAAAMHCLQRVRIVLSRHPEPDAQLEDVLLHAAWPPPDGAPRPRPATSVRLTRGSGGATVVLPQRRPPSRGDVSEPIAEADEDDEEVGSDDEVSHTGEEAEAEEALVVGATEAAPEEAAAAEAAARESDDESEEQAPEQAEQAERKESDDQVPTLLPPPPPQLQSQSSFSAGIKPHQGRGRTRTDAEALRCVDVTDELEAEIMGDALFVEVLVPSAQYDELPAALRDEQSFRVCPVLFSQGVNERQTMANAFGGAHTELQREINAENVTLLRAYVREFGALCALAGAGVLVSDAQAQILALKIDELERLVASATGAEKQVGILRGAAYICRQLGAGRVTCCKSGKDRTGMAVTLEQAAVLGNAHGGADPQHRLDTMRSRGTRRLNVLANTGKDKYAFNQLQVHFLPEEYQPPASCFASNVT